MARPPKQLTTRDMWVPTCATCHMSGINGHKVTHDPTERLSYYLADGFRRSGRITCDAQATMKEIARNAIPSRIIDRVYEKAEQVVEATNDGCRGQGDRGWTARGWLARARRSGRGSTSMYFDLWHFYGRTAKHGAFMGGADFVQWHGNYPMLEKTVELKAMAEALRGGHGHAK